MTLGAQRWTCLDEEEEMLGSGELESIVHDRVIGGDAEPMIRSHGVVEEDSVILVLQN